MQKLKLHRGLALFLAFMMILTLAPFGMAAGGEYVADAPIAPEEHITEEMAKYEGVNDSESESEAKYELVAETGNKVEGAIQPVSNLSGTIGLNGALWEFEATTGVITIGAGSVNFTNSFDGTTHWFSSEPSVRNQVKIIEFTGDVVAQPHMSHFFRHFPELTTIANLEYLNTSNVINMSNMFNNASSLTSLDLSGFDTSRVTNMTMMFGNASSLTSLDLSGFDTSSVTSMSSMFGNASSLTSLDLSGFDTSSVTSMNGMFGNAISLTSLDLSGDFDTSIVTNMAGMFNNVSSLTSLDLSGFNTSRVTNMSNMFSNASSLTSLDLSSFNTSSVTNMSGMFVNANSLTSLDLSSFDTSSVTNMNNMFRDTHSLTSLDLSDFDTSSVVSMRSMFLQARSLTSLDLSNFDTSIVTEMDFMFGSATSLTSLDLSGFDTSSVTNMAGMFNNATSLSQITFGSDFVSVGNNSLPVVPHQHGGLWQLTGTSQTANSADLWELLRNARSENQTWVWNPITINPAVTVTAPVRGATPNTTATLSTDSNFTAGAVSWAPTHNPFQGSTQYTATVTLTANAGYTFTGLTTATINGQAATVTDNTGGTVTLSYEFAETAALTPITPIPLIGVTNPTTAATPSTNIDDEDEFTSAISWNGNPTAFGEYAVHSATITLTARDGYTFPATFDDTASVAGFTVNGIAPEFVSNDGDELVLSVTFPHTADETAPTGEITVRTRSGFESFINTITFGLFFRDAVTITITGADVGGSGVDTIEYLLSDTAFNTIGDLPTTGWQEYTAAITQSANWNGFVYARITDNASNVTVIRSDGVVVFTDVAAVSESRTFGSGDLTVDIDFSGNSIDEIRLNGNLVATANFTIDTNSITFTGAYLDSLGLGGNDFIVSWNPVGITDTLVYGDTINTTTITITNNPAIINPAITITSPVTGATPNTVATLPTGSNFTAGAVSWTPTHNPFQGSTVYTASVTLTANTNHTFTGLTTATINGQAATVTNNTGGTVTLSYEFAETSTAAVTGITVQTQPSTMTYTHGDTLSLAGLVVRINYSDGTHLDVAAGNFATHNITPSLADGTTLSRATHNGTAITVSLGAFSDTTNNLTVNQAAGTFPTVTERNTTYTSGITLGSIDLPANIVWNIPSTALNAGDGQSFAATFTDPSGNYLPATGTVIVNVARATFTLANIPRSILHSDTTTQSVDLAALVADRLLGGDTMTLAFGAITGDVAIIENEEITTDGISFNIASGSTIGQTATIPVTIGGFTNFEDATVNIIVTLTATPTFAVTVVGGTGGGTFEEGDTIEITATIPDGYRFVNWTGGVTFASATSSTTTFTMPANAVTVTANFEPIPTLTVTIVGGTGGGTFVEGDTVTITATIPDGYRFVNWTGAGVTFADATSTTTTFIMPANAVTVTANFEPISVEGGCECPEGNTCDPDNGCGEDDCECPAPDDDDNGGNDNGDGGDDGNDQNNDNNQGDTDNPQTGDNSNLGLWLAMLFSSMAGLGVLIFKSRRKKA